MTRGLILATLSAPGPALAVLPQESYDNARESAPNVLVVSIEQVLTPVGDMGLCRVLGVVETVERGSAYQAGDEIAFDVWCAKPDALTPFGIIWTDLDALVASRAGRAWLDENGAIVLDQYEIMD
jgi:hypothetical protein